MAVRRGMVRGFCHGFLENWSGAKELGREGGWETRSLRPDGARLGWLALVKSGLMICVSRSLRVSGRSAGFADFSIMVRARSRSLSRGVPESSFRETLDKVSESKSVMLSVRIFRKPSVLSKAIASSEAIICHLGPSHLKPLFISRTALI